MFTNVLIGVDGRGGGRDAIGLACLLAQPTGTAGAGTSSRRIEAPTCWSLAPRLLWVISSEDVRGEKPIVADRPGATDELMDRKPKQLAQSQGLRGIVTCRGPREAPRLAIRG